MRINFRQGIVRHQTDGSNNPIFLDKVGSNVNLVVSPDFTTIAFIHGTKDYIYTESATVNAAWASVPVGIDSWLYWDLDKINGLRTFGFTTLIPVMQASMPVSPATGQMWFNTSLNMWYEFNGATFVEKIRVFAAKLTGGTVFESMSANAPLFTGTQVGLTTTVNVGSLAYDSTGTPIINQDGKFFTTEDVFTAGVPTGASLKINNIIVRGLAQEPIGAYHVVQFTDFDRINLANPFDVVESVYGIVESGVPVNDTTNVITDGIIFNQAWDWSSEGASVNDPLYIDANGQLVLVMGIPNQVAIGAVVGNQEILFKPGIFGFGAAELPVIDHGDTLGLTDDDHPQYHTDARGDVRYTLIGHTHTESGITDLDKYSTSSIDTMLALKINLTEKATANGVATLGADSKIPDDQIPLLAITNTFVVADEAEMLALTAQTGDVAIRSDEAQTYILRGADSSVLADWQQLPSPAASVLSVAGKTGVVTLELNDNTDVANVTPANKHVLIYDALVDNQYENRQLVKDDISDFLDGDYATAAQGVLANTALQDLTGTSIKELSDVFATMTPADGQVLTYDFANSRWDSAAVTAANWVHANNGVNFDVSPAGLGVRAIAIGNNANVGIYPRDCIAIGTSASVNNAISGRPNAIAIGVGAYASQNAVAVGSSANAGGTDGIAIGDGAQGTGTDAVGIGHGAQATLNQQTSIGQSIAAASVDTNVAFSAKLGYGATSADKNLLHLFDKGKLELYGDEAQFMLPNYATGSIPATTVAGGLIYDSTTDQVKVNDGTNFVPVGKVEPTTTYGTTGAIALDTTAGTYFTPTGTTTGIITFTFTNPAASGNVTAFTLQMLGAGDNAPVWPAGVEWPGGTEPTWTAGGKDVVGFISTDGGTTWLGMLGGLAFA